MSGTIPPIPPPFDASSGNPGSPNVNRVDTMPATTDLINTTNTTNMSQSVVDENLPQLLDSRGGSHVTNVPTFDKEDFTSWKVRINDMTKGKSEKGKKVKEKSEKCLLVESFDWDDESVSSDVEGSTKIKAFMAIVEDKPSEPLPPLLKLIGATLSGTSERVISFSDLTLNMALTLDTPNPKKTGPSVKVSSAYVIKKKIEKSLTDPNMCSDKKADSSTEKLLFTLMEEVKGLKRQIKIPTGTPSLSLQSSSSKASKRKT
nr:hypothetical protein [Tanacetum cinerariifolium]